RGARHAGGRHMAAWMPRDLLRIRRRCAWSLPLPASREDRLHESFRDARGHGFVGIPEGVLRERHRLAVRREVGGALRAFGDVPVELEADLVGELLVDIRAEEVDQLA